MGDTLEGNIAVVALIVSLIALIITVNQLVLQTLATADGYRRCAEPVIDIWHRRRKRNWKWSEFRFETQYVTPQIVLVNVNDFQNLVSEFGDVYHISGPHLKEDECIELHDTVHQEYSHMGLRRDATWPDTSASPPLMPVNVRRDEEKGNLRRRKKAQAKAKMRTKPKSDPLVSWLRLLRELHQLSNSYWPEDCKECTKPVWDKVETGLAETNYNILQSRGEYENHSRTDIAVIYRTWTWDFMPPDMVRPLAESNVGDIIILATRMGMKWRSLEPDFGKMQADGNGYILNSTEVRGLGVVLRFTATGHHDRFPRLIPSKAVDKLLMGIIPGHPQLVKRDFPIVDQTRNVQELGVVDGILAKIGFGDRRREQIRYSENYAELMNDLTTLLLPFLPLEDSTMTSYAFPGYNCVPGIQSVYCFWEGRIALHRKLRESVENEKASLWMRDQLAEVLEHMDFLEQNYPNDWYARWEWSNHIRNTNGSDAKLKAIKECRRIFNWTTDYFVSAQFDGVISTGQTLYVTLVAAHINMAHHALEDCYNTLRANKSRDTSQDTLKRDYNITSEHGYWFVHDLYEVGCHYVKHLHHENHGVREYFYDKRMVTDLEVIEVAWWVLQLRGIVMNLSTHHPDNIVEKIYDGNLVPSSFYGNKSPVWIT